VGDALAPWHIVILFLLLLFFVTYWVPTIVAVIRKDHLANVPSIVVINFFLGWTFIGWAVALTMACRPEPKQSQFRVPDGWIPGPGQQPPAARQ
jgi:Superinfection immunity protein